MDGRVWVCLSVHIWCITTTDLLEKVQDRKISPGVLEHNANNLERYKKCHICKKKVIEILNGVILEAVSVTAGKNVVIEKVGLICCILLMLILFNLAKLLLYWI